MQVEQNNPLISFVVLAYCQEDMIRHAVEAAFAQTYSPLEIILSDDCSSDGTYAILEEMAAAYAGPHTVRLNRNEKNLGLIEHVNRVFEMAEGDLIIPAAGDDISLPERATKLGAAFQEDRPLLLDTPIFEIDETGTIVAGPHSRLSEISSHTTQKAAHTLKSIIGASAAWSKELYEIYGPITEPGTYEDAVFYFRAKLAGRFRHVPEALVKYRRGGISWQQHDPRTNRLKKARLRVATWRQRRKDLQTYATYIDTFLQAEEENARPMIERLERLLETE